MLQFPPKHAKQAKTSLARLRKRREVLNLILGDTHEAIEKFESWLYRDATGNPALVSGGVWECEKSPTGQCAYDHDQDPSFDDCVFCHQPLERK